jgi:hypothetical protein
MSAGRNLGIGGALILLLGMLRWVVPAAMSAWRHATEEDEADAEHRREMEAIEFDLAIDRAKHFERMAERARKRPQDRVQLFDAEHRLLGWGLRVGEDPLGRPVIWVPPAIYGLVSSAEGASGPIQDARFDDGGIEGPWDEEIQDRGRWKLPSEPGWALPPESQEHGRWSDPT